MSLYRQKPLTQLKVPHNCVVAVLSVANASWALKKNTVNVVVSDVKWNLESNLRHQNLITIHNNEPLALSFSPAMFLAMENFGVYLSVSFCSDVSFTVLKKKKNI